jgi:hypothetical protein
MELQAVVKTLVGELFEVGDGVGHFVVEQFQPNLAAIGVDGGDFHENLMLCVRVPTAAKPWC